MAVPAPGTEMPDGFDPSMFDDDDAAPSPRVITPPPAKKRGRPPGAKNKAKGQPAPQPEQRGMRPSELASVFMMGMQGALHATKNARLQAAVTRNLPMYQDAFEKVAVVLDIELTPEQEAVCAVLFALGATAQVYYSHDPELPAMGGRNAA